MVKFLIALHDRPGSDEADRLLAARRGLGTGTGSAYATGREGIPGAHAVAPADDLLLLAEAGIDVHRPLTVALRPPVAGRPPVTVGRETEPAVLRRVLGRCGPGARQPWRFAAPADGEEQARCRGQRAPDQNQVIQNGSAFLSRPT